MVTYPDHVSPACLVNTASESVELLIPILIL